MMATPVTLKRCLDLGISIPVLVLALPLMLFIAASVRISMGAPVFFRQQRPGINGRPFMLAKFRTMRSARSGEDSAAYDGQRITRIGRLLRAASLDELPTLWNVLRGDMSLVGPRPLLMQYLGRYTPEQARRHDVKPGITGWAQINGRNALTWEEKFAFDVWYVDNRSLRLDMKILVLTALKVLKREGIGHAGDATMPEFRGTRQETGPGARTPQAASQKTEH